jgi:hypothetical protein
MSFQLRNADTTLKLFITTFLVVLTIGYAIGLFFVEHQTSLTATGVQEQFLGNDTAENQPELKYAKSANEMFIFMHNHILSLALIFFIVGGIFYFSSGVSASVKQFIMLEPLIAILTTFGGIALVRYVSPLFSWLVLFSGISLFLCYCAMVFFVLKELWFTQ